MKTRNRSKKKGSGHSKVDNMESNDVDSKAKQPADKGVFLEYYNKKQPACLTEFRDLLRKLREKGQNEKRKLLQRHPKKETTKQTPNENREKRRAVMETLQKKNNRHVNSNKFLSILVSHTDERPDIEIFPIIDTSLLTDKVSHIPEHGIWVAQTPTMLASAAKNFILIPSLRGNLIRQQQQWEKLKDTDENNYSHDVRVEFSDDSFDLMFTYLDRCVKRDNYNHYFLAPKTQDAKVWFVGMLRNNLLDKLLHNLGQVLGINDLIVWGYSFLMAGAYKDINPMNLHMDGVAGEEDMFYVVAVPLAVLHGCTPELLLFKRDNNGEITEGHQYKYKTNEILIFPQSKLHMTSNTESAMYEDEEMRTILFLSVASKQVDTRKYGFQAFLTMAPCYPCPTNVYGPDPAEWIGSDDNEKKAWNTNWEKEIANWPGCFDNSKQLFYDWTQKLTKKKE